MKEHMLEAVKRKRAYLQQHEEDSHGEHAEGQSAKTGDDELAPARGSHEKDALLGKPDGKNYLGNAESPEEEKNETMLGQEGGFDHEVHSSPENSRNMFHDPKVDTHDPADLNRHRNMAGDGSNSKYDKMGVDEHLDVRKQSSKLAGENATRAEGLKKKALEGVKSKMDIKSKMASSGEEAGMDSKDAVTHNGLQKGFAAPYSKVNKSGDKSMKWDQDAEGPEQKGALYGDEESDGDEEGNKMRSRMSGLKGARARLDGFLSKMKNS